MEQYLYKSMKDLSDITKWLNSLEGYSIPLESKIVRKVIDWQIFSTGRPYEYNAVVRVEVENKP